MPSHQSRELIRDGDSRTISVGVPDITAMSPKLRATWPLGRGPSIAGHSIPLAARATPAASHGRDCHTGWGASQCGLRFLLFSPTRALSSAFDHGEEFEFEPLFGAKRILKRGGREYTKRSGSTVLFRSVVATFRPCFRVP
jgi:hypothetical protein